MPPPAGPPPALLPPDLSSGLPPVDSYPAPKNVPAHVAPVLPKIPAQLAPSVGPTLPDPAGAGNLPSGLAPQGEVADSGELPIPPSFAEAQIIGLALALGATLAALLRPFGLAGPRAPWHARTRGGGEQSGANKPDAASNRAAAGESTGADDSG